MNRTWPFVLSNWQSPKRNSDAQSALFTPSSHDSTNSLFAPLHYESGYAYPLIVWLHGHGGDERHLLRVMPLVSMRNYVAVAPRGTIVAGQGPSPAECYGWQQSEEHVHEAEQRIFDAIELTAQRFHVDRQRVFLGGFDSGGTMAFRVAMSRPASFAGVLSLGGAFPTGRTPLAKLTESRRLPIFMAVGRYSGFYTPAAVCDDLRLLHAAGLSITLREYPCGHELAPQMLMDVNRWIMDQLVSSSSAAKAESDPEWSRESD